MTDHLPLEELLEVRDGEASSDAVAHVEGCSECAAEVRRLRDVASALRSLPAPKPQRDLWPALKAGLRQEQRAWIPKAVGGTLLALAASLLLVLVLPNDPQAPGLLPPGEVVDREAPITDEEVARLVSESQRLENLLRRESPVGRPMDAMNASRVADLLDRIAFIDAQLAEGHLRSPADRRAMLWRTRIGLMNELVRARATGTRYVEF